MKTAALVLVLFFSLASCADSGSNQTPKQVWITDVFIVSPESLDHIEKGSVLIENGRIVRIERSEKTKTPAGATVVLGHGQYLIPRLIDSHVHLASFLEGPPKRAYYLRLV
jgi:imidazolonepropionase-like amidohydrolase